MPRFDGWLHTLAEQAQQALYKDPSIQDPVLELIRKEHDATPAELWGLLLVAYCTSMSYKRWSEVADWVGCSLKSIRNAMTSAIDALEESPPLTRPDLWPGRLWLGRPVTGTPAGGMQPAAPTPRGANLSGASARFGGATGAAERLARILQAVGAEEREEIPSAGIEAAFERLLFGLCQARDATRLEVVASSVEDQELAGDIRRLAEALGAGAWPSGLEQVWLRVMRHEERWRVEFRVGPLDTKGSVHVTSRTEIELTPQEKLVLELEGSGVRLQLVGRMEGSLVAARARIWSGLKSVTKRLIPWGTDALGGDAVLLMDVWIPDGDVS